MEPAGTRRASSRTGIARDSPDLTEPQASGDVKTPNTLPEHDITCMNMWKACPCCWNVGSHVERVEHVAECL